MFVFLKVRYKKNHNCFAIVTNSHVLDKMSNHIHKVQMDKTVSL